MKAIGIDLGTTSICGVVVDTDSGKVLKSETVNSNAFIPKDNDWEKVQNVSAIIEKAVKIVDSFIDKDISVIGITGQMHGILYFDKEGKAVSELYTWQDARGNLPYKDTTYAAYLKSSAGYGNVTDFYNRVNGLVPETAAGYCTVHDYLAMTLADRKTPLVHTSDAASFGCFDIQTNTFSYECKIDVTSGFDTVGTYKGIPVSVAIGDNQASVFSSLASDGDILINVGTGSQVSVISDSPVFGENIESRPFFDGKFLVVGAALCGGRAYSVLKDFYAEVFKAAGIDNADVYAVMDKMLENADGVLSVDTRFEGTRADPNVSGSVTGIRTGNFTPGNLTKGVLEGMINELYDMYSRMNVKKCSIVGSGNGIRKNPQLVSAAEMKFGSKMKIPQHLEEAAYGAAMYGLVACGKFTSEQARKLIRYN